MYEKNPEMKNRFMEITEGEFVRPAYQWLWGNNAEFTSTTPS